MLTKISSMLDTIADRLEAKGLTREALEIDKVADDIDKAESARYDEPTNLYIKWKFFLKTVANKFGINVRDFNYYSVNKTPPKINISINLYQKDASVRTNKDAEALLNYLEKRGITKKFETQFNSDPTSGRYNHPRITIYNINELPPSF